MLKMIFGAFLNADVTNISLHTSLFCIKASTKVAIDWGCGSINKYGCTQHGPSPTRENIKFL